jgi:hypothetical protein
MKRRSVVLIAFLALSSDLSIGHSTLGLSSAIASGPAAASPYARFVGRWFHHGGSLKVEQNGHAAYSYRLYVFCNQQRLTTCDKLANNTIYDGGFSVFTLHHSVGNKAHGSMNNSSFSWQVGTTVTLVAKPNDTLVLYEAATAPTTFCGPQAPPGFCGA